MVDAHSNDRTQAIALQAGAQVIVRPWSDFVEARTFALHAVRTPWTLMLDADEILDDRLRGAISQIAFACPAGEPEVDGYRLSRTTFFCGKPMRMWSGEKLLRLFRTDRARLQASPVTRSTAGLHEHWIVDGRTAALPGTIFHQSYPTVASYRVKFERYISIEAEHLQASRSNLARETAVAVLRFGWLLFARGALLDGWRGCYVAYYSALYPVAVAQRVRDCGQGDDLQAHDR